MNLTLKNNTELTMTSLELVEFINENRKSESASDTFSVLSHSDFYKKAKVVLGEGVGKFSDTHQNPQNKQFYPIYRFPKREACLMAMSYSYDLQAKVFDRMTALEVADPLAGLPAEQRALIGVMLDNAAIKAKQAEQDAQIASQADSIKRLEAKQSAFEDGASFFTVIGFGVHRGISFGLTDAAALGRAAAKLSKEHGIAVDKVKDPRFGSVNSYHETMLDAALAKIHGGM